MALSQCDQAQSYSLALSIIRWAWAQNMRHLYVLHFLVAPPLPHPPVLQESQRYFVPMSSATLPARFEALGGLHKIAQGLSSLPGEARHYRNTHMGTTSFCKIEKLDMVCCRSIEEGGHE